MRWTDRHFSSLRDGYRLADGKRRTPLGAFELSLAGVAAGQWVRLGAFYGEAPGSRMAGKHFAGWVTRAYGMTGVNVRFGWWPRPCVTLLLHTRMAADSPYMAGPWAQAVYEAEVIERGA